MDKKQIFLEAIHNKKVVKVKVDTAEKRIIERECIPFDYGQSSIYKDGLDRYHFLDLNSPDGPHNLSIFPSRLLSIEFTGKIFDPINYVHWQPNWHIKRDWGSKS